MCGCATINATYKAARGIVSLAEAGRMIGVNRKTMWRWSRDGVFLSTVYHPNGRRAGVWLPMFLSEYPWIENDKPPQNI